MANISLVKANTQYNGIDTTSSPSSTTLTAISGKQYHIANIGTGGNLLTVNYGASSIELADGKAILVLYDGTNWIKQEESSSIVWDSSILYETGEVVWYTDTFYKALQQNINSQPDSNPSDWVPVFSGNSLFWDSSVTYAIGEVVYYSGFFYSSLENSNLGNIPVSSPSYWHDLRTPISQTITATGTLTINSYFDMHVISDTSGGPNTITLGSPAFEGQRVVIKSEGADLTYLKGPGIYVDSLALGLPCNLDITFKAIDGEWIADSGGCAEYVDSSWDVTVSSKGDFIFRRIDPYISSTSAITRAHPMAVTSVLGRDVCMEYQTGGIARDMIIVNISGSFESNLSNLSYGAVRYDLGSFAAQGTNDRNYLTVEGKL
jgi:hypothetical protein